MPRKETVGQGHYPDPYIFYNEIIFVGKNNDLKETDLTVLFKSDDYFLLPKNLEANFPQLEFCKLHFRSAVLEYSNS